MYWNNCLNSSNRNAIINATGWGSLLTYYGCRQSIRSDVHTAASFKPVGVRLLRRFVCVVVVVPAAFEYYFFHSVVVLTYDYVSK